MRTLDEELPPPLPAPEKSTACERKDVLAGCPAGSAVRPCWAAAAGRRCSIATSRSSGESKGLSSPDDSAASTLCWICSGAMMDERELPNAPGEVELRPAVVASCGIDWAA